MKIIETLLASLLLQQAEGIGETFNNIPHTIKQ